jgi:hypothetical protein
MSKFERKETEKTYWNFALIFRTTEDAFEKIKDAALDAGAVVFYQTKSADKIWIAKGPERK